MTNAARSFAAILILTLAAPAFAEDPKKEPPKEVQWVEGFDKVEFHHDVNFAANARDFRGTSRGYMTAAWWAPGQMKKNLVSWHTDQAEER